MRLSDFFCSITLGVAGPDPDSESFLVHGPVMPAAEQHQVAERRCPVLCPVPHVVRNMPISVVMVRIG